MTRFILAAALAASLASPAALAAQEPRTRTIEYAPSMLLHDDSVAMLQSEISRAAQAVCRQSGLRGLQALQNARDCETSTSATAFAEFNFRVAQARANRGTVTITRADTPAASLDVQVF